MKKKAILAVAASMVLAASMAFAACNNDKGDNGVGNLIADADKIVSEQVTKEQWIAAFAEENFRGIKNGKMEVIESIDSTKSEDEDERGTRTGTTVWEWTEEGSYQLFRAEQSGAFIDYEDGYGAEVVTEIYGLYRNRRSCFKIDIDEESKKHISPEDCSWEGFAEITSFGEWVLDDNEGDDLDDNEGDEVDFSGGYFPLPPIGSTMYEGYYEFSEFQDYAYGLFTYNSAKRGYVLDSAKIDALVEKIEAYCDAETDDGFEEEFVAWMEEVPYYLLDDLEEWTAKLKENKYECVIKFKDGKVKSVSASGIMNDEWYENAEFKTAYVYTYGGQKLTFPDILLKAE